MSLPKTVQAVAFDIGSVIVHVEKSLCASKLYEYSSLDYLSIKNELGGTEYKTEDHSPTWGQIGLSDRGKISEQQFYEGICKTLQLNGMTFEDFKSTWQSMIILDRRFPELIRRLRRNKFKTAIISDLGFIHYERMKEIISFDELFDAVFISSEHGHLKAEEDGRAFDWISEQIEIPCRHILFIDDRAVNIEVAKMKDLCDFHYSGDFDKMVSRMESYGLLNKR